jgi:uncharacterized membrane protein
MVIGAWIRHYFNLRHQGRTLWWIPVTAAAALAGIAVWIRPPAAPAVRARGAPVQFARVQQIVTQRCTFCHSIHPRSTRYTTAPMGVKLDTPQEIKAQASTIEAVAVATKVMPLGNTTKMTQRERDLLGRWIAQGAKIH